MSPSSPIVWTATVAGVAILAVAAGVVALSSEPHEASARARALLNIAVVAPPEREVAPGGILDVGQLTDGYVHTDPAPRPAPEIIDAYLPDEDVLYPVGVRPRAPDTAEAAPYAPIVSAGATPVASGSQQAQPDNPLSFGFDAPRPDYAAEREARRARLDALEANAHATTAGDAASAPDTFY